jgi:hypothetical protein
VQNEEAAGIVALFHKVFSFIDFAEVEVLKECFSNAGL